MVTVGRMEGLAQDIRGQGPLPCLSETEEGRSTFWGVWAAVWTPWAPRGAKKGGGWSAGCAAPPAWHWPVGLRGPLLPLLAPL